MLKMATRSVPSPPRNDFLDGLFSQNTQPNYSDRFPSGLFHTTTKDILGQSVHSFGGESFYDHIPQMREEEEEERGHMSAHTVPYTPSLQYNNTIPPNTNEQRIHFPYNDEGQRNVIGLRPVTEIPQRYQGVFSSFSHFNLIQSKVFDDVLYTDSHLVTSAPTGSGKTVIFELAIVRVLMRMNGTFNTLKIVYVAPIKALCNERYEDWSVKFGHYGLRCAELTGDSQLDDYFELQNAQIIMTTPEKWDSMTRKWRDNKSLVQLVSLFLLDEVHQLNDEARGPTVEAIVSRMKTIRMSVVRDSTRSSNGLLRFLAISATIPNVKDIACWLGSEESPAIVHSIDDSHRPVQLRRVVLGFPDANTEFKFDLSLNYKLSGVIQCYSDQKPSLIFCATRKGTQQAASILVKDARFVMNMEHKRKLQAIASSVNDSKLKELIVYGVGYHHAGLSANDRKLIETMFTSGELPVLFATSTLAMGVNLPAHLVVIKSTLHYVGGMFQEYSESQILQMIGRAGRPQFDTSATAVILTRQSTKSKYEALLSGSQLIESNLHSHLIEHLNAEIVLDTVTDVSIALEWLKSTFLYIRIKSNPKHYNIPENIPPSELEEKLQEMCLKDLHLLQSVGLINMEDGFTLTPTETGKLMARYYVAFDSMNRFLKLKGTENLGELVEELSKCQEFHEVRLRVNEKRILNQLNKDKHRATIRFPMSSKIKSTDMKVNCLLQATMGCLYVQEFSLNQDTQKIFRSASRLCRCLLELALLGNEYNKLLNSVLLYKCVQSKLWENSKYVVRQLDKIGLALSTSLVNAGVISFDKLLEKNPRELELIVNRNPPFGNQVREAASKCPKYSINIEQVKSSVLVGSQAELVITISLVNHALLNETGSTAGPAHTCILIIGNSADELILKQKIVDSQLLSTGVWSRRVTVSQCTNEDSLNVHYISLEYVGFDIQQTFTPHFTVKRPSSIPFTQAPPPVVIEPEQRDKATNVKNSSVKTRHKTCSHRCVNKAVCGHDCCKYGLEENRQDTVKKTLATPLKRKGETFEHMKQLHHRVQSMPPTPGVKKIKLINSNNYRSSPQFTPQSTLLRHEYSYTPKPKLSSLPAQQVITNTVHHEEEEYSLYELEDDYDDFSPPPLPPPLFPLPQNTSRHNNTPLLNKRPSSYLTPTTPSLPPPSSLSSLQSCSNERSYKDSPYYYSNKTHSDDPLLQRKDKSIELDNNKMRQTKSKRNILSDLNNSLSYSHTQTAPPVQQGPPNNSNSTTVLPFFASNSKTKQVTDDDDDLFGSVFAGIF